MQFLGSVVPSGLERWTGGRMVPGLNPAAAISLWNFGNSVYSVLPVSFGGDSKSIRALLSGVGKEKIPPVCTGNV